MTPAELRLIIRASDIYKISLGKSARYRSEALEHGVLVFQSDLGLYDAVVAADDEAVARAGRLVITDNHPNAGAPGNAIAVWRRTIETFIALPRLTLVVHWEADLGHLYWGLTDGDPYLVRRDSGEWGQEGLVFHRPLVGGWRKTSIGGVPLSNMHPKARDYAINFATLNKVQTDPDYFRALILDADTSGWEAKPTWAAVARSTGWRSKDRSTILASQRQKMITQLVQETADFFQQEISRMAGTAVHTALYANGQTVLSTVKNKDIGFSRVELEEEIAALMRDQNNCCALTRYPFKINEANPHLRPSLDRKNSGQGYIPGNLQVVTRAANFFKSASDEQDWQLKARAMVKMAVAIQRASKEA